MIEMYEKAGRIVSEVRESALKEIKDSMKVIDLVNFVENKIKELGAVPAFPCNVSINEITAHYTSPPNDQTQINSGDLVKLDLGAHVDGYIADTAITIVAGYSDDADINNDKLTTDFKLIEVVEEALDNAISTIRSGVSVGRIGEVVEETVTSHGFNPISNLTGHSMDRWILHSGLSIPNIKENNPHQLEEGDVLAIEPFVTAGIGYVVDMKDAYIFRFLRDRPIRMIQAKELLNQISREYKNLPFAQRWLSETFKGRKMTMALRQLISARAVYPYHVLKEKSDARVSQAEHTVIVETDSCQVITE